jgi:hypothetical protein
MLPYFERVASDLWDGKWETILTMRHAGDRERLYIEAMILCRYGRSLSLRGTPEKVRDTLAAARRRHVAPAAFFAKEKAPLRAP